MLGYVLVYIGLTTLLPWLLGYLVARLVRARRARAGAQTPTGDPQR